MRHVSGTHRVNLGWLLGRFDLVSNISMRYVHSNMNTVRLCSVCTRVSPRNACHAIQVRRLKGGVRP